MEKSGVPGTLMLRSGAVGESAVPVVVNRSIPQKQRPVGLKVMLQGDSPHGSHLPDSGEAPRILLCPPELHTPGMDGDLEGDTRRLIGRCLTDFTGLSTAEWMQSKAQSTMQKVVVELVDKHRFKFNGIIKQLSLEQKGDNMAFIQDVAQSLFADGTTNWGRVATLVAFGAVVSLYLKNNGRGSCVEKVAREISKYLLSHHRTWLVVHNSWDGFVEFFERTDPQTTARNALLALVGLSSVMAAGIAFLFR